MATKVKEKSAATTRGAHVTLGDRGAVAMAGSRESRIDDAGRRVWFAPEASRGRD